jgi:hypothetical protein
LLGGSSLSVRPYIVWGGSPPFNCFTIYSILNYTFGRTFYLHIVSLNL